MLPRVQVVLLCIAATLASGCKKGGISRLEGHWRGTRIDGIPPDQAPAATAMAAQFELEVKGDTLTIRTPKERAVSHVVVVREDKGTLVLQSDADGPAEETFTFADDHTVTWKADARVNVTFAKDAE